MLFPELLAMYPGTLSQREGLICTESDDPSILAQHFWRDGVLQMKSALPSKRLQDLRIEIKRYGEEVASAAQAGEVRRDISAYLDGQGNYPWELRDSGRFLMSWLIPALTESWAWPVVEAVCGSNSIVVFVSICFMRRRIDTVLGVGAHQDCDGLGTDAPITIWMPLQPVQAGHAGGIGFLLGAPHSAMPHEAGGVNEATVLAYAQAQNLFAPFYQVGDISVHHMFTPYFAVGVGSGAECFSVEVRCSAAGSAPTYLSDPSVLVTNDSGAPRIQSMRVSREHTGRAFVRSISTAPMQII